MHASSLNRGNQLPADKWTTIISSCKYIKKLNDIRKLSHHAIQLTYNYMYTLFTLSKSCARWRSYEPSVRFWSSRKYHSQASARCKPCSTEVKKNTLPIMWSRQNRHGVKSNVACIVLEMDRVCQPTTKLLVSAKVDVSSTTRYFKRHQMQTSKRMLNSTISISSKRLVKLQALLFFISLLGTDKKA